MRAEHFAQRPVQDVRGGVVPADPVAAHLVDRGFHLVAHLDRPGADDALVHDDGARDAVLGVANVERGTAEGRDQAGVADLATGFGVERGAIERDLHRRAVAGLIGKLAADDERDHLRLADRLASPGELSRPELVEHVAPDRAVTGGGAGLVGGRARPAPAVASCAGRSRRDRHRGPRAPAISRVRSIGNPSVSCRKNASLPLTSPLVEQVAEHLDAALQRRPERLLLAFDDLRHVSRPATISGYAAPITSTATSIIVGSTSSRAPRRYEWRTARRMMRRST